MTGPEKTNEAPLLTWCSKVEGLGMAPAYLSSEAEEDIIE
jgi:hypothetical protein